MQYAYRLWLEDSEGKELQIEHSIAQNSNPLSNNFYRDIVKRTPHAFKCYEIYTMYLSYASVPIISAHEQALIKMFK